MLPLIPVTLGTGAALIGASALVHGRGISRSRLRARRPVVRRATLPVRILAHHLDQGESRILGIEDVPLDNRNGTEKVVSEHEFSRTATNRFSIQATRNIERSLGAEALSVLKGRLETEVGRKLGIDVGTEITRLIRLRFIAGPGQLAHYRVV